MMIRRSRKQYITNRLYDIWKLSVEYLEATGTQNFVESLLDLSDPKWYNSMIVILSNDAVGLELLDRNESSSAQYMRIRTAKRISEK